jgi:stress response protein YsnF
MNYEKIVTLFDTAQHADAARRELETAGFPSSDISYISSKTTAPGARLREPGLWQRLFGRDIAQDEATVYGRTVESGGVVLTVRAPESEVPRAMRILNAHNLVDVKGRAAEQRLSSETAQTTKAAPVMSAPATFPGEEVVALAEEQMNVGKRVVDRGTTRVRRFVTEKPVETQVSLHEEHVEVIRRAITDPEYVRNLEWADKTIELSETAEEPVISKTAHVVEEVVIRKEGKDHTETLRDKVRRQQVDVERTTGSEQKRKAG